MKQSFALFTSPHHLSHFGRLSEPVAKLPLPLGEGSGEGAWSRYCHQLLAILAVLAGCNHKAKTPRPQPYPVSGKVLFQGKPAAGFRVAFYPIKELPGPQFAPSAMTDANGEFHLQSYQPNDGAPAGNYAVTFTWPQEVPNRDDPGDAPNIVDRLHGRFSDPKKSQLNVTVHKGENTLQPFNVK
ncbi:MAG TPA: carboxypeptidase regulatory-like domain-containing protein [Lacipirellulaceae bacterium]|nr:carboxypeptidase regulatory-like domain-containing protein [Lacipirellulaceae bacterium]